MSTETEEKTRRCEFRVKMASGGRPCGNQASRHYRNYGYRCDFHPAQGEWAAIAFKEGEEESMIFMSPVAQRIGQELFALYGSASNQFFAPKYPEGIDIEGLKDKGWMCSYPGCEAVQELTSQTGAGSRCRKHHGLAATAEVEGLAALKDSLIKWWQGKANEEIELVVPKAVEYGASDLLIMGEAMKTLIGRPEWPDKRGMEMACAFYALGKVARAFGAYERGEVPSDDVWHDLGVYCRMAQKIRETGVWVEPVRKKEKEKIKPL